MVNLYDSAKAYKKKDITSLEEIDIKHLEIKEDTFGEGKDKRSYNYFEIDGWKYTVKAEALQLLKDLIEIRPMTTKVKFYRNKDGELAVMPID